MKRKSFRKVDGLKYGWLKSAKKIMILLIAVFVILRLAVGISFVKGDSMEPTLYDGELVFYRRISFGYKPGDVVSVRIPSGEYYLKRIIAVAGDTVEIRDGKVYRNGTPLEEPYAVGETLEQEGAVRYPITLQEGQLFVMGDNRAQSMDSRSFGVVGTRQIKGKILLRVGWAYLKAVSSVSQN